MNLGVDPWLITPAPVGVLGALVMGEWLSVKQLSDYTNLTTQQVRAVVQDLVDKGAVIPDGMRFRATDLGRRAVLQGLVVSGHWKLAEGTA